MMLDKIFKRLSMHKAVKTVLSDLANTDGVESIYHFSDGSALYAFKSNEYECYPCEICLVNSDGGIEKSISFDCEPVHEDISTVVHYFLGLAL